MYEGRAGGDYVVGAHASYNNIGSVGISLLGTYDTTPLNIAQESSLKNLVYTVSKKYNINLNDSVMGFYPCSTASCYPIKVVYTKALLGHRDVGVTSCPGDAIYSRLGDWRNEIMSYSGNISVISMPTTATSTPNTTLSIKPTISGMFDSTVTTTQSQTVQINTPTLNSAPALPSFSSEIPVVRTLSSQERNNLVSLQYSPEKIGIKLSYPNNLTTIKLRPFDSLEGVLQLDGNSQYLAPNTEVVISLVNNGLSVKV